jgi:hypothetical protein
MRKQSIPVSYLLKENQRKTATPQTMQRKFIRQKIRETKATVYKFAYPALSNILKSGALSLNESQAVLFYLAYRNNYRNTIPVLNDTVIRKINEELKRPNINQKLMTEAVRLHSNKGLLKEYKILSEGPIGNFFKKVYDLGSKGASWLGGLISGGWNAIKAAWGNFKELVSSATAAIKDWLWKFAEKINSTVKSSLSWCGDMWKKGADALKGAPDQIKSLEANLKTKLGDKGLSGHLEDEMKTFGQNMNALKGGINKIMTGDDIAAAAANPPDEIGKEVDALGESVSRHMKGNRYKQAFIAEAKRSLHEKYLNSIRQEYNSFFSNKTCMTILREIQIPLKEGGSGGHPEDIIKLLAKDAPDDSTRKKVVTAMHKVVKIVIKILKWVFNPIAAAATTVIKFVMANLFKGINYIGGLKFFGGPGVGEAVGLGLLFSELAEIVGHNKKAIHLGVEAMYEYGGTVLEGIFSFIPGIGAIVKTILTIIQVMGYVFYYYAIGTLIINAIPMIKMVISLLSGAAQAVTKAAGAAAGAGATSEAPAATQEAVTPFQSTPKFEPAVNKIKSVMQTFFRKLEKAPGDVQRDFAQIYNSIIGKSRRLTRLELEKIVDVLEPVLTSAGFNLKLKNQELAVAFMQALKQTKNLQSKVPATVLKEDYFPTTGTDERDLRDAKKALAKWFMNTKRNPNTPSGQASAGTLSKQQLDILHDLIDDYALAYAQDYMDNIDMERNTF